MIIERLKEIQAKDNLSDQEFADKLGIHRVTWNRIKTRRVPFGKKFLCCVRQALPEVKDAIDIFLLGEVTAVSTVPMNRTTRDKHYRRFLGALRAFYDVCIVVLKMLFRRT